MNSVSMKTLVFLLRIVLLSFIVSEANGQGDLQYNRVLLVSSPQTVPPGCVWKVESVGQSSGDVQNVNISGMRIVVNGNDIFLTDRSGTPTSNNAFFPSMMPMWLPAGTTLAAGTGASWISVIEFIIEP